MLSEKSQDILTEQFNTLPTEIQDTILESNWKEVIHRITEKYALHIDQGGALETIVFLTMLGLEEPANFITNLKDEVRITQSLAQAITNDVERDIFQKIRRDVMKKQEVKEEVPQEVKGNTQTENSAPQIRQADKPITISDEGVSIIEDEEETPKQDMYREDLFVPQGHVDGQHLNAEAILDEIEDPQEPSFQPSSTTSTSTENNQPANPASNPLSIRTLKSDILRHKLENPSWSPATDKKTASPSTPPTPNTLSTPAPSTTPDPYREAM